MTMFNAASKTLRLLTLLGALICVQTASATDLDVALLKTNESHKSSFSAQPGIKRGEFTLPAQEPVVHVIRQSLPDFLRQAALRNGLRITLSDRVQGELERVSLPMDIRQIMTRISGQYGLKWHLERNQLFVSAGKANTTRLIFLGGTQLSDLRAALRQQGIETRLVSLSYSRETNSLMIDGPEETINGFEQVAKTLNRKNRKRHNRIEIIKLKSAASN